MISGESRSRFCFRRLSILKRGIEIAIFDFFASPPKQRHTITHESLLSPHQRACKTAQRQKKQHMQAKTTTRAIRRFLTTSLEMESKRTHGGVIAHSRHTGSRKRVDIVRSSRIEITKIEIVPFSIDRARDRNRLFLPLIV